MIVAAVPACNEEKTIGRVVTGAVRQVDKVIVIDDGSSDATAEIAEKAGATVIRHLQNLGKGEALRTIFKWARSNDVDVLVTMDGDGQHLPEQIPHVMKPVLDGEADISIGSRFVDGASHEMGRYRRMGTTVIGGVVRAVSGSEVKDTESGFRAYNRKALAVTPTEMGMGVDSELLLRVTRRGLRVVEVPITVAYAGLSTSTHNPFYHAFDVLLSVFKYLSIRHPLIFYGLPGLVALGFGLYLGFQAFDIFSRSGTFPPNLGIIAVGAALTGFVLLSVGIILFTIITVIRERT